MSTGFWIRRFFMVLLGAFVLIAGAQLLKEHALQYSVVHGAVWGTISAAIFTVTRYFRSRRGQHCAICNDTPEMQQITADGIESAERPVQTDRT